MRTGSYHCVVICAVQVYVNKHKFHTPEKDPSSPGDAEIEARQDHAAIAVETSKLEVVIQLSLLSLLSPALSVEHACNSFEEARVKSPSEINVARIDSHD